MIQKNLAYVLLKNFHAKSNPREYLQRHATFFTYAYERTHSNRPSEHIDKKSSNLIIDIQRNSKHFHSFKTKFPRIFLDTFLSSSDWKMAQIVINHLEMVDWYYFSISETNQLNLYFPWKMSMSFKYFQAEEA